MRFLLLGTLFLAGPMAWAAHPTLTTWAASGTGVTCDDAANRVCRATVGTVMTITYATAGSTGTCDTTSLAAAVAATPGGGYTQGDILTVSGGNGAARIKVEQTFTNGGTPGAIGIADVTAGGTTYTAGTGVSVSGGTGSGAGFTTFVNTCYIFDNQGTVYNQSSSSGTQNITLTAGHHKYWPRFSSFEGPALNMTSCGHDPESQPEEDCRIEIDVEVGVGTGTGITIPNSPPSTMSSGEAIDIIVSNSNGGCANLSQSTGCSGGHLTTNQNPHEDAGGAAIFCGQSTGRCYRVDADYCSTEYCGSENNWKFSFIVPKTPEVFNWTVNYGDQADYKQFTGTFTSQFGTCYSCYQPLQLYGGGSPTRLKTASDGHAVTSLVGVNTGNIAFAWRNGAGQFYDDVGGAKSYQNWAAIGWNGVQLIGSQEENAMPAQACFNTHTFGTLPSPGGCGARQAYPVNRFGGFFPGNAGAPPYGMSWSLYASAMRTMAKRGVYYWGGSWSTSTNGCNGTDIYQPLGCNTGTSPAQTDTAIQLYRMTFDQMPWMTIFSITSGDQATLPNQNYLNSIPDYIRTFYPLHLVAYGQWPQNGVITDFSNVDVRYVQNYPGGTPVSPSLNWYANWKNSPVVAQLRNVVPGVVMDEAGGLSCGSGVGGIDSDTPYNERYANQILWHAMLTMLVSSQADYAGTGDGTPGFATNCPEGQMYLGAQQVAQTTTFEGHRFDLDPAAIHVTSNPTVSGCTNTYTVDGIESTRDVILFISNESNRNACATATLTYNVPAANMQGNWYHWWNGTRIGSAVTLTSSGSQSIPLPNTFDGSYIVLRLRSTTAGPIIRTVSVPNVLVNVAYSQTLEAQGGTCASASTWRIIEGAPPKGITLSSAGLLSGTPTVPDDYPMWVVATCSGVDSPVQKYVIRVYEPLSFRYTSQYIPFQINAASSTVRSCNGVIGGVPPITASFSPAFTSTYTSNPVSGPLCGWHGQNVATPATDTITVTATDNAGNMATQTLTIKVKSFGIFGNTIQTANSLKYDWTVGRWEGWCFQKIGGGGGAASATWTVVGGAGNLPPGLSLSQNCNGDATTNAELFGTPTTPGVYTFTIQAILTATPTATGSSGTNTITVSANAGVQYGLSASGTGIAPGATVTGVSGTTITLSANNTGAVSGIVTFTGTDTEAITIRVNAAPTLTSASLPTASAGTPYYYQFTTSNGTIPACKLNNNSYLPRGFLLLARSCMLVGTGYTADAGTTNFSVDVVDANNATSTQAFTLVLSGSAPPTPIPSLKITGNAVVH